MNQRYKTREEQEEFVTAYSKHRLDGYSKDSFLDCDAETIEAVRKRIDPDLRELMAIADRQYKFYWEALVKENDSAHRSACIIFGAKNALGWHDDVRNKTQRFILDRSLDSLGQLNQLLHARSEGLLEATQAENLINTVLSIAKEKRDSELLKSLSERLTQLEGDINGTDSLEENELDEKC